MKLLSKAAIFLLTGLAAFFIYSFAVRSPSIVDQDNYGNTISERFKVPDGYTRLACKDSSFGAWARTIKLKPYGAKVKLYNGDLKSRQDVHAAVLDFDCGTKNLQQCADAVMRIRAEYLYSVKKSNDIKFHYTSGDLIPFSRWKNGERPYVKKNKVLWSSGKPKCSDHECLKSYLWNVFNYAGTLSVEKETKPIANVHDIMPGDIFVLGGSPGHAVTVLDVAVNNKTGKKIFLLCQSYMPAQDIHVLKNFNDNLLSPWYSEDFGEVLETPEWDFGKTNLRRY